MMIQSLTLQETTVNSITIDLPALLSFIVISYIVPYVTAFLVAKSWPSYIKGMICLLVSFIASLAMLFANGKVDTTDFLALGMAILTGSHIFYNVFSKNQALRIQDAFGITDALMDKLTNGK